MNVEQTVDDETAREALATAPVVLDMSFDQGDEVALGALSWGAAAILARCEDPSDALYELSEQMSSDLNAILAGVNVGDDVRDQFMLEERERT
jgi:CRISPR/Cas system-associated exonuclease Cas4 (RecB family)